MVRWRRKSFHDVWNGERPKAAERVFRKLFHGTVGRVKARGMATLDIYTAAKSVFSEKGTKLKLKVALQPIIRLNVKFLYKSIAGLA